MRLEPIILELEREQNDLLVIAHESVLRVLYGYLMACNAADIPFLQFPRNEIVEVSLTFVCALNMADGILVRLSPRATRMRQGEYKFPTFQRRLFLLLPKILRFLCLLAEWFLPRVDWAVRWTAVQHRKAASVLLASVKGSLSSM